MGKSKKLVIPIFVVIIAVILVYVLFISQNAFVPSENTLIQYSDNLNPYTQGSEDYLSKAIKSNDVLINTGVDVFNFKLSESSGVKDLSVCSYSPIQANIDVYQNNNKIDTLTGVMNCPGSQATYKYNSNKYCDNLNNCVEVGIAQGYGDSATGLSKGWILSYKLLPSNNSVAVNVENVNGVIQIKVKNNLNIKLTGTIKNVYEATTVLGNQKVENETTIILNPLEEKTYNVNLPSLTSGSYNVYSILNLNTDGSIYTGLNIPDYASGATDSRGRIVPLKISSESIIPFAKITSDTFKVEFNEDQQTTITPITGGSIEVPSTTTTTITTTTTNPISPPSSSSLGNAHSSLWIVVSVLIIIGLLAGVVVYYLFYNKRRRK